MSGIYMNSELQIKYKCYFLTYLYTFCSIKAISYTFWSTKPINYTLCTMGSLVWIKVYALQCYFVACLYLFA
jgi:hypothetical protein